MIKLNWALWIHCVYKNTLKLFEIYIMHNEIKKLPTPIHTYTHKYLMCVLSFYLAMYILINRHMHLNLLWTSLSLSCIHTHTYIYMCVCVCVCVCVCAYLLKSFENIVNPLCSKAMLVFYFNQALYICILGSQ